MRLEKPIHHPHLCFNCRADSTSSRKWFIDTGNEAEWEGVIYFCDSCFTDMAQTVGFLTKEQSDILLGEQMHQIESYTKLLAKFEHLEDVWNNITGKSLTDFLEHLEALREHDGKLNISLTRTVRPTKPDNPEPEPDGIRTESDYSASNILI